MKHTHYLLLSLALSLSACSGVNDSFQCGSETSNTCLSVPEVNRQVNAGEITLHGEETPKEIPTMTLSFASNKMEYPTAANIYGKPMRWGETVHGVWIAPFEDRDGNYHAAHRVYVLTNPSHWLKNPPKELLEEEIDHD
jgi:conjugal transfer pilus assembly protein TraV